MYKKFTAVLLIVCMLFTAKSSIFSVNAETVDTGADVAAVEADAEAAGDYVEGAAEAGDDKDAVDKENVTETDNVNDAGTAGASAADNTEVKNTTDTADVSIPDNTDKTDAAVSNDTDKTDAAVNNDTDKTDAAATGGTGKTDTSTDGVDKNDSSATDDVKTDVSDSDKTETAAPAIDAGKNDGGTSADNSADDQKQSFADMNVEAQYKYLQTLGTEEEKQEALAALTQEQRDALSAYIAEMEEPSEEPSEDTETVEKSFSEMTVEEQYKYLQALETEEEKQEALAALTQEQLDALNAYIAEMDGEEEKELTEEQKAFLEMTVEEQYEYLLTLEDEAEIQALLELLTEEQLQALLDYAAEREGIAEEEDETDEFKAAANFAKVALFQNIVSGRSMKRAAARSLVKATEETDALVLDKTATYNGNDGTYQIKLEAYTTGSVTTSQETKPCDIILVLDQSSSMTRSFSENSTSYNEVYELDESKTYYVKGNYSYRAVTWCDVCKAWTNGCTTRWGVHSAGTKYTPKENSGDAESGHYQFYERVTISAMTRLEALKQAATAFIGNVASQEGDPRIAIVGFGTGVNYLTGTGSDALWDASEKEADLKRIINNLSASYNATEHGAGLSGAVNIFADSNEERKKIVVLFTDGEPAPSGTDDWSYRIVSEAIENAYILKNNYSAAVYTISVMPGTDAAQGTTDMDKYMNYISSNYPEARYTGSITSGNTSNTARVISQITPGTKADTGDTSFYLTAGDIETLESIFEQIANQTGNSGIQLGSNTVIQDTVSKYFRLPEGATENDITVEVYDAYYDAGDLCWKKSEREFDLKVELSGKNVSVSGFDFDRNFVAENGRIEGNVSQEGDFHGRKIVITFNVVPEDEFIGGNDVLTNNESTSGVYREDNDTPIKTFDTPTVNVEIKDPDFTVTSKTMYKGNPTTTTDLYEIEDENNSDNSWKYDYVNVIKTIDGNPITGNVVSPEDCTDYTVKVVYEPKSNGTSSQQSGGGDPQSGTDKTLTATIHVLTPKIEVTAEDVEKYYGEEYTLGGAELEVKWEDSNEDETHVPGEPEGTAPFTKNDLNISYTVDEKSVTSITVPKEDVTVGIVVKMGDNELGEDFPVVINTSCDLGCNPATRNDGTYIVHVKTCQLTITKNDVGTDEVFIFNIKKDGGSYTSVTVASGSSVTIKELPVGTYTVEEDTDWAWRYEPDVASKDAALSSAQHSVDVYFTNTKNNDKWLSFSTVVKNIFVEKKGVKVK